MLSEEHKRILESGTFKEQMQLIGEHIENDQFVIEATNYFRKFHKLPEIPEWNDKS